MHWNQVSPVNAEFSHSDFSLWSKFPVRHLGFSVPNWTVNAASKGFVSDGTLNAKPLRYVAHEREFPKAEPGLIIIVSNRIIKPAVCHGNIKYI